MEFYDIALAKLLQAVPELGNYIVTFKDVSDELSDDSDMKVGIFILKSGNEYMFVPVVGKGDNTYPIDSIFFASKSKFFPLTKKTINVIASLTQNVQGKATDIPTSVVKNPDLYSLVNPPRTGKFVYATSSRLGEFLQAMPNYLKKFTMDKIASEQSAYDNIHKLFGLQDILTYLKPAPESTAAETNVVSISVIDTPSTTLTDGDIQQVLDKGYVIKGTNPVSRVAVSSIDYNSSGQFTQVTELDGDRDYELMMSDGNSREAFIPKQVLDFTDRSGDSYSSAIFTNGDYAIGSSFISVGDVKDRKNILTTLFDFNPPVLPRDVNKDDVFAILTPDTKLLGIFRANSVVLNNMGVEISGSVRSGGYASVTIRAYRNFGNPFLLEPRKFGYDLFIPYASVIVKLGNDVSGSMEINVNSASKKRQINEAGGLLGDQIDLGFDGVEFFVNRKPMAKEAKVMHRLVVEEGIDPEQATKFIKQAKENKFVKIYLTKSASNDAIAPAEIPQYGVLPDPQGKLGLNGSFMPNVQTALQTNDAQNVEATIISELLQAPDMFELIGEYLPDIEECIDRLGRILLLSRVHIEKLSDSNDADNVFAFLANLKAVYRMLGDNFLKLQSLVAMNSTAAGTEDDGSTKVVANSK